MKLTNQFDMLSNRICSNVDISESKWWDAFLKTLPLKISEGFNEIRKLGWTFSRVFSTNNFPIMDSKRGDSSPFTHIAHLVDYFLNGKMTNFLCVRENRFNGAKGAFAPYTPTSEFDLMIAQISCTKNKFSISQSWDMKEPTHVMIGT